MSIALSKYMDTQTSLTAALVLPWYSYMTYVMTRLFSLHAYAAVALSCMQTLSSIYHCTENNHLPVNVCAHAI